jgi:hypothetical protein
MDLTPFTVRSCVFYFSPVYAFSLSLVSFKFLKLFSNIFSNLLSNLLSYHVLPCLTMSSTTDISVHQFLFINFCSSISVVRQSCKLFLVETCVPLVTVLQCFDGYMERGQPRPGAARGVMPSPCIHSFH